MIIGQIKDGIVLDHITAGRGMEIYKILNLDKLDCTVAMIERAVSPKMGRKDIIKVDQLIDLTLMCSVTWTPASPSTLSKTARLLSGSI